MRMLAVRGTIALLALTVALAPVRAEDEVPTFKSKAQLEKEFFKKVCKAILKAAHFSGKDPALDRFELKEIKKGRTSLIMKGSYKGRITSKKYIANIIVHLDTLEKGNWEVLRIEYSDNNNIPYSRKKVDALIKKFNSKE